VGKKGKPLLAVPTGRIRTTSYLPDLNVWLALSWANHMHSGTLDLVFPAGGRSLFLLPADATRLLRLLATSAVMARMCGPSARPGRCTTGGLRIRESESGRRRLNSMGLPCGNRRFPGSHRRKRLAIAICSRSAKSRCYARDRLIGVWHRMPESRQRVALLEPRTLAEGEADAGRRTLPSQRG